MTTLILTLVWVLLFIPVAVSLRLLGKQRMPMRFDRSRESYWEERDVAENDFKLLERQY